MSGLIAAGSIVLGPTGGGSSGPTTLPEYLASIGKATWYGGFIAPNNLFSDIANTVAVTTDGASWRNWLTYQSAGGFSASFGQSTGSRRCALGTSRNGKPGVYGDGVDWYATLSSTTELNRQHTVLMSAWITCAAGPPCLYSHNNQQMRLICPTSVGSMPTFYAASTSQGVKANHVLQGTPVDASTFAARMGWSTDAANSAYYNFSPNLFRSSTDAAYSSSTIHELWFVEKLTPAEITEALKFLA